MLIHNAKINAINTTLCFSIYQFTCNKNTKQPTANIIGSFIFSIKIKKLQKKAKNTINKKIIQIKQCIFSRDFDFKNHSFTMHKNLYQY